MGRKKTKYQIYRKGLYTGKYMYCDEIAREFGLDQRNISKYSELGGRIYLQEWNFVPFYDTEKEPTPLLKDWEKVTKQAKERIFTTYFVLAKRVDELMDCSIEPRVYKTNASTKQIAMENTQKDLGPEYAVLDATSKIDNISFLKNRMANRKAQ